MRILVTISRDWDDYETILAALLDASSAADQAPTLVHGASQMDWFIAGLAYGFGWEIESHPADWSKGKGAGFARNYIMIQKGADLCLAFIKNGSHGASHCAQAAENAGIPTRRYTAE